MNEREVQAFLSGLPKHVPQRTAKFRAGQIISDSQHGLSGVGVVGKRTRRHLRRGAGRARRAAQFHRRGECFGICNLLVAEPLQTVLALRGGDDGCAFGKRKRWLRRARRRGAGDGLCGAVQREDPVSAFAH